MYVRNLTSAAVLVLILCSALLAQPRCSAGSLTGTWAYTAIGWTVPAGESTAAPTTMIGILVIDYAGKVSGPGTSTSGAPIPGTPIPAGQPLDFEMVDTSIEVNADCTGLFKYSI